MTVVTSEVPEHTKSTLNELQIPTEKREREREREILPTRKAPKHHNRFLHKQITRTPNIQVKHGLKIFYIRFVPNDSAVKSEGYRGGPQERRHAEEMSTISLSIAKESF